MQAYCSVESAVMTFSKAIHRPRASSETAGYKRGGISAMLLN